MTNKNEILKEINSNPHLAMEALETLYHNKTYVITAYNRVDKFFKTRRGAEGHQKRQGNISWYDDYTQEMVSADTGNITEIQDHEIVDPTTSKKMWYFYIKKVWSKNWLLNNLLNEAKNIVIDNELLKWIEKIVNDIKETDSFLWIEEFEETKAIENIKEIKMIEENEIEESDVKETERMTLINKGIERIKEAGRIKTGDFKDIIEELEQYGMGFTDAQNVITETYINQVEETEEQEQETVKGKEEIEKNIGVEISFNEEKNGIEIKFDGKPEKTILENLKSNGFRWSRYQKIWYAKDTEEKREFIKQFDATVTESEHKIFEYPEIDIDDLENYTVDADLSRRENDGNWIFRSKERNHSGELQETLKHYQDLAIEIINETDDKEIVYKLKSDLQRFKKAYSSNYIAAITNKANNPSWAVTGRAGRNISKMEKANNRYNDLIGKSLEIIDTFKNSLDKHSNKIRAERKREQYKDIENTDIKIDFKVETKEIIYLKVTQNLRTYNYKNYMIVKLWGSYKIFKDEKVIKDMRTTDTLKMTKKALQLIINKEKRELQEVI